MTAGPRGTYNSLGIYCSYASEEGIQHKVATHLIKIRSKRHRDCPQTSTMISPSRNLWIDSEPSQLRGASAIESALFAARGAMRFHW